MKTKQIQIQKHPLDDKSNIGLSAKCKEVDFVQFFKQTNYPKLGYIIYRLKELGIACRLHTGNSWQRAPVLEIDAQKIGEAWQLLGEKHGRGMALDDMRDNHPKFRPFEDEKPDEPAR